MQHGTLNGYTLHKCRCLDCKAAKADYYASFYKLNRDKIRASTARWTKLNLGRKKASDVRWLQLNPGRAKEYYARWYKFNPGKAKEHRTRWRELNPSKIKATRARYRKTEHGKQVYRLVRHRRRARKMNAPGFCTREQLEARIAFYGWRCWMCRAPYEAIDHVKPLACGGSNWPANLRPACRSCNSRKGAKVSSMEARNAKAF